MLAVGRLKAGPERELAAHYLERARRTGGGLGFRGFEVREIAESRAARAVDRIAEEGAALAAQLAAGGRIVALDPAGELLSSEVLAERLRTDNDAGVARTIFVIGVPDGLGPEPALADRRVSFGRMTFPHGLVRILLAEQLYRAMTILSGHPYHRA